MNNHVPADLLTATARGARLVAGLVSAEALEDYVAPLREARAEGRKTELGMALALRCADLARKAYGPQAQTVLDGFAFDALSYVSRFDNGETIR